MLLKKTLESCEPKNVKAGVNEKERAIIKSELANIPNLSQIAVKAKII